MAGSVLIEVWASPLSYCGRVTEQSMDEVLANWGERSARSAENPRQ